MILDLKCLEKSNSKRTVVLADWRGAGGEKESFMYWKQVGDDGLGFGIGFGIGFIKKTSILVIPDAVKREFFKFAPSRSEINPNLETILPLFFSVLLTLNYLANHDILLTTGIPCIFNAVGDDEGDGCKGKMNWKDKKKLGMLRCGSWKKTQSIFYGTFF